MAKAARKTTGKAVARKKPKPPGPTRAQLDAILSEQGGEDVIFDRIAAGERFRDIAATYNLTRQALHNWLNAGPPERRAKYDAARKAAGHAYVEKAEDVLVDAATDRGLDTAHATIARERSNFYRWLAGKLNRDFSDDNAVAVNVNVDLGRMHLDALRAVCAPAVNELPAPTMDAEILEEN